MEQGWAQQMPGSGLPMTCISLNTMLNFKGDSLGVSVYLLLSRVLDLRQQLLP